VLGVYMWRDINGDKGSMSSCTCSQMQREKKISSVLQCVAVCCSVLQCGALCVAACFSVLQCAGCIYVLGP